MNLHRNFLSSALVDNNNEMADSIYTIRNSESVMYSHRRPGMKPTPGLMQARQNKLSKQIGF